MTKRNAAAAIAMLAALSAAARAQATYQIDSAHSDAQFSVRHMMISNVKGEFTSVAGTILYDPNHVENLKVDATIDVNTISTRQPQRDAHLKSADFFDVERLPERSFRSTRVDRVGGDDLAVTGDLTIHGVTREVVFKVEGPTSPGKDPWGNTRIGLSATTKINRKDYGLTWNAALETGGILVGDEVTITLDVQFVKSA